jgi:hypothetical protein
MEIVEDSLHADISQRQRNGPSPGTQPNTHSSGGSSEKHARQFMDTTAASAASATAAASVPAASGGLSLVGAERRECPDRRRVRSLPSA